MSISVKHQELHAKNVEESTLKMDSSLEKHQDYSQVQVNQPIYQSPSSIVETADTLIPNSFQRNSPNWTRYIYDGLQSMIYGGSSSDE
mgnify:CR=1 FL=1